MNHEAAIDVLGMHRGLSWGKTERVTSILDVAVVDWNTGTPGRRSCMDATIAKTTIGHTIAKTTALQTIVKTTMVNKCQQRKKAKAKYVS